MPVVLERKQRAKGRKIEVEMIGKALWKAWNWKKAERRVQERG